MGVQLRELREYVSRRQWEPAVEYIDAGFSGAKASRPALDRLMAAADRRDFDCVLVWKIDRFGRSVLNLSQHLALLTSYGVRFIAVSQALDTDASNPSSRLMLTILAGVAEFEREIIRERTLAGVHAARAAGKTLGRPRRVFRRDQVARMRAGGPELARDSCRARPTCFHCARGHQRRSLLASSGILPWSAFVGLIREVGVLKLPPIRLLARVAARSAVWRYTSR